MRARLPMIAQLAGASALVAAVAMPRLADVEPPPPTLPPAVAAPQVVEEAPKPVVALPSRRPAHLNLDVRHAFRSVDLSVSVDGRRVLDTTLTGSGKRFKVFGKRAEKGYTRSLNLSPGVRLVQVRVRSEADKFDQTRVERFDLDSAAVAGMRIAADKTGLSVVAERPEVVYERRAAAPVQAVAPPPPPPPAAPVAQVAQFAQAAQAAQQAGALAELYQTLRSVLIAVAGFVASAATGYVVQEFLRSRKSVIGL